MHSQTSQNSEENLNFVFERDKSTKNRYNKIDYSKKKVFPANNSLEILSNHTEPDTEMFIFSIYFVKDLNEFKNKVVLLYWENWKIIRIMG